MITSMEESSSEDCETPAQILNEREGEGGGGEREGRGWEGEERERERDRHRHRGGERCCGWV